MANSIAVMTLICRLAPCPLSQGLQPGPAALRYLLPSEKQETELEFLSAMAHALLPRAWWGDWQPRSTVTLRRAALLEGWLQMLVFAAVQVWRYVFFFALRARQMSAVAGTNEGTQLYYSFIVTVEFLLVNAPSLLFEYLALEGAVRALAIWTNGEVVPNWFLSLIALATRSSAARSAERALGARVPDVVQPGDGQRFALRVASCRKKDWTPSLTISYRDALYELVGEEQGPAPRRFVYLLRANPPSKIVRGLREYDPNDVQGV